jgi:hypothetical protein
MGLNAVVLRLDGIYLYLMKQEKEKVELKHVDFLTQSLIFIAPKN